MPLTLKWSGANPSTGVGTVAWSIPRVHVGAAYELSLFDVAGRKVSTLARGVVSPGRFTREASLGVGDGRVLPSGVFFLRLKVGSEIRGRTLVVTR